MKFRFEVGLDDIGIGLDMMSNSDEEREEVLDFITHLDESMADADFTHNLIYRLSVAISHDTEVRGWEPVALPEARATTFAQLYEALSYMDEDELISLMANATMVRRERDSVAAANAVLCEACEHPMGVHNMVCLPGLTGCCHACDEGPCEYKEGAHE